MEIIAFSILAYFGYRLYMSKQATISNNDNGLNEVTVGILDELNNILTVLLRKSDTATEYPSVWHILLVDVYKAQSAVKNKPRDVPVLTVAGLETTFALELTANSETTISMEDKGLLLELAKRLAIQVAMGMPALMRAHGGKVSTVESDEARRFIHDQTVPASTK